LNRLNASAMTSNLYRSRYSLKSLVIRKSTSRICVGPRKKFFGKTGAREPAALALSDEPPVTPPSIPEYLTHPMVIDGEKVEKLEDASNAF
jgi:hypothetical protein